jgi:hypothetical protein
MPMLDRDARAVLRLRTVFGFWDLFGSHRVNDALYPSKVWTNKQTYRETHRALFPKSPESRRW